MRASFLPPVSRPLAAAATATAILAATALVLGIAEVAAIQPQRRIVGVGSAVLLIGYAGVLALITRGLWRARRWSRGPAVALQIMHIFVGWSFVGGATTWVAVVVIGLALVVLVSVLLPSSTKLLTDDG